jgi:hypothetical protein
MLGLDNAQAVKDHSPVPFEVTGVIERANYRIEKLHYESLPNLHVTANLYLPNVEKAERRPAVLYVCGHVEQQKVHYQGHPKRFAELGFPTLIVETVQYGEAAEIILAGEVSSTYDWGEDLYHRLGAGGRFHRLKAISDWTLFS